MRFIKEVIIDRKDFKKIEAFHHVLKDKLDSRTTMDFEFSKMYVGADADDVLEIF
ncbi:hypothetical protein [Bacillus nakamurai]|uniref:hypothetical protein n=1 Tax=Bacillus nakamurai TaxID=1793963 RepID=UPI0020C35C63|nr:hypothetical protein [Bacillus nakamurai]MCP6681782.1 hypothetical protein [Bacillus nakamurai]